MFNTFINVCFERRVFIRIPKMVTTKDASKGIECPKFSGKDEDNQVWVTKFEAYAMVKGFYKIMDGTEVLVPCAQANKNAEELKLEEKKTSDIARCSWLWIAKEMHSARSLMQSRRTGQKGA